ncbi:hypothetical protein V6N13_050575 [Hibiscus sabdariffa]
MRRSCLLLHRLVERLMREVLDLKQELNLRWPKGRQLVGDAYTGWTMVISGLDGDKITWEFFQLAYRKKHLSTRYENEEKREFVALVQGSMSMSEYEIQL